MEKKNIAPVCRTGEVFLLVTPVLGRVGTEVALFLCVKKINV
jgi:hypothetical protein